MSSASALYLYAASVYASSLIMAWLLSPQLPGGCGNEPGPRGPSDQGPHVGRVGPGPTQAVRLPAAGPPQPAQQEGAAPADDAPGPGQPLASHRLGGGEGSLQGWRSDGSVSSAFSVDTKEERS